MFEHTVGSIAERMCNLCMEKWDIALKIEGYFTDIVAQQL